MKVLKYIAFVLFISFITLTIEHMKKTPEIINVIALLQPDTLRLQTRTPEQITEIIIHNSAISSLEANTAKRIKSIETYHKQTQGWASFAYHYFVDNAGKIYQCNSDLSITAHTEGHNTNAISICVDGNFDLIEPNLNQYWHTALLVASLQKKYNIKTINKHSDFNQTSCPGILFDFNLLESIVKGLKIV